jgi:PhzF family phenazine biosynthesis protein
LGSLVQYRNDFRVTPPLAHIAASIDHQEIEQTGHPTIGAACHALGVLAPNAPLSHARLLCNAGPIEVSLESGTGVARAAIPHNIHVHTQHALTAESVLSDFQPGLQASDIVADGVAIVSPVKGMTFALIELSSLEALGRVRLSAQASQVVIQRDQDWDVGFTGSYFYFVETRGDDYHEPRKPWRIRSRMVEGSIEDPATGSAACALTGFLALREGTSADFEITQGVEMGRKSDIGVSVTLRDDGKGVERMELSGCSVPVMDGTLYL